MPFTNIKKELSISLYKICFLTTKMLENNYFAVSNVFFDNIHNKNTLPKNGAYILEVVTSWRKRVKSNNGTKHVRSLKLVKDHNGRMTMFYICFRCRIYTDFIKSEENSSKTIQLCSPDEWKHTHWISTRSANIVRISKLRVLANVREFTYVKTCSCWNKS